MDTCAYIFPRQRHFLAKHGADKSSAPRFIGSAPLCRARPPRIPPDKPRGYRPLDPMTFGRRILLPSRAIVRSISAGSESRNSARERPRDFCCALFMTKQGGSIYLDVRARARVEQR